ncbi:MAG: YbjQ family protein [Nitrospirota bacterium]|nr:YbjQ family protein [Nitrospirota bacterium]
MELLTIEYVPGWEIQAMSSGMIVETEIVGLNVIRDMFARIRDVFGGKSGSYNDKAIETVREVLERIARRATEYGADAVVGLNVHTNYVVSSKLSMFHVVASGTLVQKIRVVQGMEKAHTREGSEQWVSPERRGL